MDCGPPGSSVHVTSQARILEWVVISYCRGSSPPWGRAHVSCIGRRVLYSDPPGKPKHLYTHHLSLTTIKTLLYFICLLLSLSLCLSPSYSFSFPFSFLPSIIICHFIPYIVLTTMSIFLYNHNPYHT